MEDFGPIEQLCALLVVLYLVECIRWVGRGSLLIRSFVPLRWEVSSPWQPAAQWRKALALGAPWPPLGALYVADALPVVIGPAGVTVRLAGAAATVTPSASSVHVPWPEVKRLSVSDTELRLDKEPVAVLGTRRAAHALRSLFAEVAEAKASRREAILRRFLDRRFDTAEITARRASWRRWGTPLVFACNLLILAFAAAVVLLLFTRYEAYWRVILLGLLFCWTLTATLLDVALLKVLPKEARPPLGRRVITLLSPMSLSRSADDVRAELFGDLDGLAVAACFLRPAALRRAGRELFASHRWPVTPTDGAPVEAASRDDGWLRDELLQRQRALLKARGIDADLLARDGLVPDGGSRSFCPRCRAQYVQPDGVCTQCAGVALLPLSAAGAGGADLAQAPSASTEPRSA